MELLTVVVSQLHPETVSAPVPRRRSPDRLLHWESLGRWSWPVELGVQAVAPGIRRRLLLVVLLVVACVRLLIISPLLLLRVSWVLMVLRCMVLRQRVAPLVCARVSPGLRDFALLHANELAHAQAPADEQNHRENVKSPNDPAACGASAQRGRSGRVSTDYEEERFWLCKRQVVSRCCVALFFKPAA